MICGKSRPLVRRSPLKEVTRILVVVYLWLDCRWIEYWLFVSKVGTHSRLQLAPALKRPRYLICSPSIYGLPPNTDHSRKTKSMTLTSSSLRRVSNDHVTLFVANLSMDCRWIECWPFLKDSTRTPSRFQLAPGLKRPRYLICSQSVYGLDCRWIECWPFLKEKKHDIFQLACCLSNDHVTLILANRRIMGRLPIKEEIVRGFGWNCHLRVVLEAPE